MWCLVHTGGVGVDDLTRGCVGQGHRETPPSLRTLTPSHALSSSATAPRTQLPANTTLSLSLSLPNQESRIFSNSSATAPDAYEADIDGAAEGGVGAGGAGAQGAQGRGAMGPPGQSHKKKKKNGKRT